MDHVLNSGRIWWLPTVAGWVVAGVACAAPSGSSSNTNGVARTPLACTARLLARSTPYDSSRALDLVGQYRLERVDTVSGRSYVPAPSSVHQQPRLRLWATDSAHRYSRINLITRQPQAIYRPIVGAILGADTSGSTADNPQIVLDSHALDWLTLRHTPKLMLDGGAIQHLPISVLDSWGFGGYYSEDGSILFSGPDGKIDKPGAGYYCAFRVSQ